ncbi:MAG: hypothetical protein MJZ75_03420 [Paludibacteraceae bacterium]|nr:hypothetical protein [Paludibacteraceae bacterium]
MEQLKNAIQKRINRTMESPKDFEYLSEQIQHTIGEYLSPTTLKRIFGFIPMNGTPRPSTLSILARYVGYSGWQDYLDKQHVESDFVTTSKILTSELSIGQKITLAWNPNRECVIEYLGENRFVVLHSANAKLQIGDQFACAQFVVGQPMTASDFKSLREPSIPNTYIAGAKTGLTKLEILPCSIAK